MFRIDAWLADRPAMGSGSPRKRTGDFVERTIAELARGVAYAGSAENASNHAGFIRQMDPRAKWVCCLLLILTAVSSHRLLVTLCLFLGALLLAAYSRALPSACKILLGALAFTGLTVLPSLFIINGPALFHITGTYWIITIPGAERAANMLFRTGTTTTLALTLVLTTRWSHLLKSLRFFRVPTVFVVLLGMTQRYIFLLIQLSQSFFEARRVRMLGRMRRSLQRELAVSNAAVLLSKSTQLSEEVFQAMQARGFRGTVYTLDEFKMKPADWAAIAASATVGVTVFWLQGTP